jgi:hypothetical protein
MMVGWKLSKIDLDNDIQTFYYNDDLLYQDSWTDHVSGNGLLNIGAVDLFANNASSVYYDDLSLVEVVPGPCELSGEITWLSSTPDSGTTPAGETSLVDVLFDATGASPGVYNGTLCVESNDLEMPLVPVPITMTVEAVAYGIEFVPDQSVIKQPWDKLGYDYTHCRQCRDTLISRGAAI